MHHFAQLTKYPACTRYFSERSRDMTMSIGGLRKLGLGVGLGVKPEEVFKA